MACEAWSSAMMYRMFGRSLEAPKAIGLAAIRLRKFRRFIEPLSQSDLFRLQALGALLHNKRHAGALIEGPVATCGNSRKVDENVFPVFTLDKSESFACVKPLHCTCFFHDSLSLRSVFGVRA